MALRLKYQGRQQNRTRGQASYRQTFYATESEIDSFIAELQIGSVVEGKGKLNSWRKSQMQGIFWEIELQYITNYSTSGSSDDSSTMVGEKSATLSTRNIQLPIEHHPNYRNNWNYYLYSNKATSSTPSWWYTESDLSIHDDDSFRWIKNPDEIKQSVDGENWKIVEKPSMQGVQVYDWTSYVVTISTKYESATAAGNSIQKKINKIVSPDQDFGINGGNWKLDDVSVQYDGDSWIATQTYTRSGDQSGWSQQLYSR